MSSDAMSVRGTARALAELNATITTFTASVQEQNRLMAEHTRMLAAEVERQKTLLDAVEQAVAMTRGAP